MLVIRVPDCQRPSRDINKEDWRVETKKKYFAFDNSVPTEKSSWFQESCIFIEQKYFSFKMKQFGESRV